MRLPGLFLTINLLILPFLAAGATVDSLDIPSAAMKKKLRAAVILPASYQTPAKSKSTYPVLYLLHGGYGHFNDWLNQTPDKTLLQRLADQYNLLIVMPEGEVFSYYLDSPVLKDSQFETYLTKDVIDKIDNTYRTVRTNKGRVITGLSMGGYGALYLATRHPDLYCAAGSMSGALNLDMDSWKLPPDAAKNIKLEFAKILGPIEQSPDHYASFSVINLADRMKTNGLTLIFDCGVDDFLIEPNRELHRRLVFNQTPHDYSERPGGHSWDYWGNSLPNHVLFFNKVLKANGSTAQ
ncbi:alpha/beta hydrolase [Spirosoma endophyticum]|uniref:S-formylglutathione hydrolase FrmB n=1 Tax=Spirosoma endophyticum TaxID=662367 RepID=A0A1I1ER35_9BACT|nr:alpha/beta hydrolase family protein [Spirosoma endophyticum]SFB89146.1 S-formylglutathione hydrolase FrmB [Spirosoma endophyticum]